MIVSYGGWYFNAFKGTLEIIGEQEIHTVWSSPSSGGRRFRSCRFRQRCRFDRVRAEIVSFNETNISSKAEPRQAPELTNDLLFFLRQHRRTRVFGTTVVVRHAARLTTNTASNKMALFPDKNF